MSLKKKFEENEISLLYNIVWVIIRSQTVVDRIYKFLLLQRMNNAEKTNCFAVEKQGPFFTFIFTIRRRIYIMYIFYRVFEFFLRVWQTHPSVIDIKNYLREKTYAFI